MRPDFSDYVLHFTTDRKPFNHAQIAGSAPAKAVAGMSPLNRRLNMLPQKADAKGLIMATPMPWSGAEACCFTECVWGSLPDHAERYSPYGLGFEKNFLFACGGGPALYVRADLYAKQKGLCNGNTCTSNSGGSGFHPHFHSFITPFWPKYAPRRHREQHYGNKAETGVDFSYEREWRLPHNLEFSLDKVRIIVVKSHEDLEKFPAWLRNKVTERVVVMEVYKNIEKFWPTHLV